MPVIVFDRLLSHVSGDASDLPEPHAHRRKLPATASENVVIDAYRPKFILV